MGPYTGEVLRNEIFSQTEAFVKKVKEDRTSKDKLVYFFAHDSTLASFFYAFNLDKLLDKMPENKFLSYYAIETTISEESTRHCFKFGDTEADQEKVIVDTI